MQQDVHSLLEGYREQVEGLAQELQGLRSARASADSYGKSLQSIAESLAEVVDKLQPLAARPEEGERRILGGVQKALESLEVQREESARNTQRVFFGALVLNVVLSAFIAFRLMTAS